MKFKNCLLIIMIVAFVSVNAQRDKLISNSLKTQDEFVGKALPKMQIEGWVGEQPELEGKFIVLDFWATWCKPCIGSIPHLNKLNKKFAEENIVFIAYSNEPKEKIEAMKTPTIESYIAYDTQGRLPKALGIKAIPHYIIVDPDGIVRKNTGWISEDVIKETLEKYSK